MPTDIPEQSQNDPSEEETLQAQKVVLVAAERSEQTRRASVEDALKLYGKLIEKLAVASTALEQVTSISEQFRTLLRRRPMASTESDREAIRIVYLKLDRILRLKEIEKTAGTARVHVTRIHKGASVVSRAAVDWTDELIHPDAGNSFE